MNLELEPYLYLTIWHCFLTKDINRELKHLVSQIMLSKDLVIFTKAVAAEGGSSITSLEEKKGDKGPPID